MNTIGDLRTAPEAGRGIRLTLPDGSIAVVHRAEDDSWRHTAMDGSWHRLGGPPVRIWLNITGPLRTAGLRELMPVLGACEVGYGARPGDFEVTIPAGRPITLESK